MYQASRATKTKLKVNKSYIGIPIEKKIQILMENKEPMKDNVAITYTERKDGVLKQFNIRTDRWDEAVELASKVSKTHLTKREGRIALKTPKKDEPGAAGQTVETKE